MPRARGLRWIYYSCSFVCKRADGVNPWKVAVDRTRPNGLVLGIDVIPAQPPQGVSTIQGNFLSQTVQDEVKRFLRANWNRKHQHQSPPEEENEPSLAGGFGKTPRSCLEQERHSEILAPKIIHGRKTGIHAGRHIIDIHGDGMVDVVLSDMSAPWKQTEGFWKRSLSDPYYRMMNTSGINFKDHAGSMVRYPFSCSMTMNQHRGRPFRIYVKPPWNLLSIHSELAGISSVNSIKAPKIRHWKHIWRHFSLKCTATSRHLLEACGFQAGSLSDMLLTVRRNPKKRSLLP